jgi:hypothetical protein
MAIKVEKNHHAKEAGSGHECEGVTSKSQQGSIFSDFELSLAFLSIFALDRSIWPSPAVCT